MTIDIRTTSLYQEIESLCKTLRQPGTGQISDAAEAHASPDGRYVVFAGVIMDRLEGTPPTRICRTELATGETQVLTFGPNCDRMPKFSPDGRWVAFLSDRHNTGDFQLYILDLVGGGALNTPRVNGWVEYFHWSPDGQRVLLGVAGHGADVASGQGAISSRRIAEDLPSWVPTIDTQDEGYRWRRAWMYDTITQAVRQVSSADLNIWESVWCGNDALAAVVSHGPSEGLWYNAYLSLIDLDTGNARDLYRPLDQVGWPVSDPSGEHVAVVEALCSDRWYVAGELRLIHVASSDYKQVNTQGVDINYAEWRSSSELLLAGLRGFQTVIGLYDVISDTFTEVWASHELTVGGIQITVSGTGGARDCVLVGEGFTRAPEIAVIRQGQYTPVKSFDLGYNHQAQAIKTIDRIIWQAPDGLEIQGWLLRPEGKTPHPLVTRIHGGPVGHWRPEWLGRARNLLSLALIKRGYAIFLPNPRGSSGRGQAFAKTVLGEVGGAETTDHLSGLEFLVEQGLADPARLGVTGGSHGGFMSAWLVTQDNRFAAAVAVAPVTNFVSQHLISNIPDFVSLFLQDKFNNPGGKYFERSPVMHAHNVRTPTMSVCGVLDRCTPPEEAVQFHNALLENGVRSVLVTYPEEGHGIYGFPALIDYLARVVSWFEEHLEVNT
jgi:dipeptidyl aminopeptidase/acylaminoacyl peptidase